MGKWKLKDKNGKFRSSRAFKQDCAQDSEEEWEKKRGPNFAKYRKYL